MANPAVITDGKAVVTSGSTTVTGIGTAWSTLATRGSILEVGGVVGMVKSDPRGVAADPPANGELELFLPWAGETSAGGGDDYVLVTFRDGGAFAEAFEELIQRLGPGGMVVFKEGEPNPADVRNGDVVISSNGIIYQKRSGVMVAVASGLKFDAYSTSLAERDEFDDRPEGFTFFLIDEEESGFYAKLSADNADWSPKVPLGAGPQGAPGSETVVATSASEVEIGAGTKTFTLVEEGRGYGVGARLRASSDANPGTNWMEGLVTSYSGNTLELDVTEIGGSGTFDDWTINITGRQGGQGPANTLEIGTVEGGEEAGATIIGTAPNQTLDLVLPQGDAGDNGWTPVLATITDGERRVHQVVDWVGGQGTKPATGDYVGASGLTSNIAEAVNIRGPGGSGSGDMEKSTYDPQSKEADAFDSANHDFDNANTDLVNDTVQGAIEELDADLAALTSDVADVEGVAGTALQPDDIGVSVQGYDADTAKLDIEAQAITGGARVTVKDLGSLSGQTITLDPGGRPGQKITNDGAGTIQPGSNYGYFYLDVINASGAGAITTTGWDDVNGDAFDTDTDSKFRCVVCITADMATLWVRKMPV